MDVSVANVLNGFDSFFTYAFDVEMLVKLAALGFKAYFRDPSNVFDTLINIPSTVDEIVAY